ncbi:MAG TPA: ArsR family transcriptional regulator [Bacteroidales bacterium]|nr:ArsR family transcriptional regulator [Bacteroidales bacterium]
MIDALITSRTRIKLITRFFLNANAKAHLRGLATEFGESSNAIRLELNRFEKAGLLTSSKDGIKKVFQANTDHPLFSDLHSILLKHLGFDQIIQKVIDGLGDIRRVYVTGDYANGIDAEAIELLFVGNVVDEKYLAELVRKAERLIHRVINYLVHTETEEREFLTDKEDTEYLLLWQYDT